MIKLLRVHERLYVADAAPVDVGNGREKFLCFIASADSQAPFLDLAKVFGRDGAVARIPVQTAPASLADRVEILSGVTAGDVLLGASAGR